MDFVSSGQVNTSLQYTVIGMIAVAYPLPPPIQYSLVKFAFILNKCIVSYFVLHNESWKSAYKYGFYNEIWRQLVGGSWALLGLILVNIGGSRNPESNALH